MLVGFGDKPLHFRRDTLITKVKENREKHLSAFEEAWPVWVDHVRKAGAALQDECHRKRDGYDAIDFGDLTDLQMKRPQPKVKDYDRAIAVLEMATEAEIELNAQQFAQLVLDDWSWKRQFVGSVAGYMSAEGKKKLQIRVDD